MNAANRGSNGAWSKTFRLSGPDASGSVAPQLALDSTGDVTAVWSRSLGTNTVVERATRSAVTGSWRAATQISPSGPDALTPRIAVDRRGDGVIVWTSSDPSGLGVVASVRRPGLAWGPPTTLASAVSGPLAPQIALDARGDALAVWSHSAGGYSRVEASALSAGGASWASVRVPSKPGGDALTPEVALDADGNGVVAWSRDNGQSFAVEGAGLDGSGPVLDKLSIPAGGVVGRRLTYAVTAKDVWSAVRTISWSFGDGVAARGRLAGHAYARAGRYAVQVTATDSLGHVTSVRRWVRIATA